MKKKRKNRVISPENRDFFRLGFLASEAKCPGVQRALDLMQTTNKNLLEIINETDEKQPVMGVVLTFKLTRQVASALKKNGQNAPLADKVLVFLSQAEKRTADLVLAELDGIVG